MESLRDAFADSIIYCGGFKAQQVGRRGSPAAQLGTCAPLPSSW
jgi:hypothetical protein